MVGNHSSQPPLEGLDIPKNWLLVLRAMPPPWGEPAFRSEESESGATRELSTKLEPSLLRGVPLHVALTGWGRHWKNSENGMFTLEQGPQGEAKRYELSCPTASLDAFLSHDWASNARLKVLSLVIIYNSRAAFLACLAVSILVGVLRAEGLLPSEIWMATFGHLSFFFVLALWQRIRMLFCRPQLVFLDKLCISQQDEQCFGGVSEKEPPSLSLPTLSSVSRLVQG